MDIEEIRLAALDDFGGVDRDLQQATNKMSDVLGFMWRRGVLTRYPAPKDGTSFARFSYAWNEKPEPDARPIPPPPSPSIGKSKLNIVEKDNGVEIELDCKYNPDGDGEHPVYARWSWRHQVAQQSTISGYWAWVEHMIVNE